MVPTILIFLIQPTPHPKLDESGFTRLLSCDSVHIISLAKASTAESNHSERIAKRNDIDALEAISLPVAQGSLRGGGK